MIKFKLKTASCCVWKRWPMRLNQDSKVSGFEIKSMNWNILKESWGDVQSRGLWVYHCEWAALTLHCVWALSNDVKKTWMSRLHFVLLHKNEAIISVMQPSCFGDVIQSQSLCSSDWCYWAPPIPTHDKISNKGHLLFMTLYYTILCCPSVNWAKSGKWTFQQTVIRLTVIKKYGNQFWEKKLFGMHFDYLIWPTFPSANTEGRNFWLILEPDTSRWLRCSVFTFQDRCCRPSFSSKWFYPWGDLSVSSRTCSNTQTRGH